MIQTVLVIALFLGALFYVGKRIYDSANGKKQGCEKCDARELHKFS